MCSYVCGCVESVCECVFAHLRRCIFNVVVSVKGDLGKERVCVCPKGQLRILKCGCI